MATHRSKSSSVWDMLRIRISFIKCCRVISITVLPSETIILNSTCIAREACSSPASVYGTSSLRSSPVQLLQFQDTVHGQKMATTAALIAARITGAVISIGNKINKSMDKVVYVRGFDSYGGLKANNSIISLGMPV